MGKQRQRGKRNGASTMQRIDCFMAALRSDEIRKPTMKYLKDENRKASK